MTGLLGPRPVRCGPSRTTASACASQRRTYRAPRPWPETASRPLLCTTSSARSCEPGWPRCAADNRPASISLTRGSPATDGDGPHRCRLDSCLQPVLQRKSAISPKTPPRHNSQLAPSSPSPPNIYDDSTPSKEESSFLELSEPFKPP